MRKRLRREFYTRPTLIVAKDILGKYLVVKKNKSQIIGKIVETEAYLGPEDRASHAYNGKVTKRCKPVYLKGGHLYIYLCYGIHWQLNITTRKEGDPECILIRALEPVVGNCSNYEIRKLANGPGKLCRWMNIDKRFNEEDLVYSKKIWVEKRKENKKSQIISAKRIGIDYAEEWADKLWRFYLKDNEFVSKK
jgi:DNA-3-methyladenine glycosylase